jgi:hypothetical protein
MSWRTILGPVAVFLVLAGCIAGPHRENAALRMRFPGDSPPQLLTFAPPTSDYPSTGGDILKGASPGEQAAARAAAISGPPGKP